MKRSINKILLILPFFACIIILLIFAFYKPSFGYAGHPSPTSNKPIIMTLSFFSFGYLVFLLMMFSENIKKMLGLRIE